MKSVKLILLLLSLSGAAMSQPTGVAAPFTGVKWENELPVVRVNDQWYHLEKIDSIKVTSILDYAREHHASKWRKRFGEDLMELFAGMEYQPNDSVLLTVRRNGQSIQLTAALTYENRQQVNRYNYEQNSKDPAKVLISSSAALADLRDFEQILQTTSSYAAANQYDYQADIDQLRNNILNRAQVSQAFLLKELGTILGQIGDRHASLRSTYLPKKMWSLPFVTAPMGSDKVLALTPNGDQYRYWDEQFPIITAINGVPVGELMTRMDYEEVKAPKMARHHRFATRLYTLAGKLLTDEQEVTQQIKVTLSNLEGSQSIQKAVTLQRRPLKAWEDIGSTERQYSEHLSRQQYDQLFNRFPNNIGYVALPEMADADEYPGFYEAIQAKMKEFKDTKALIIDIRSNGGGSRDLLQLMAAYFLPPKQPGHLANIASVRVDTVLNTDIPPMEGRYLHTYLSTAFDENDRKVISRFMKSFQPNLVLENEQFSDYYFMILHGGQVNESYHYDKPVYILINERSFSASSIFAAALKGIDHIKLAGVTTDGSSGLSNLHLLKQSGLILRISRMVSFQPDGQPLDGHGTAPDIVLRRDENQLLGKTDSQLKNLLKLISHQ